MNFSICKNIFYALIFIVNSSSSQDSINSAILNLNFGYGKDFPYNLSQTPFVLFSYENRFYDFNAEVEIRSFFLGLGFRCVFGTEERTYNLNLKAFNVSDNFKFKSKDNDKIITPVLIAGVNLWKNNYFDLRLRMELQWILASTKMGETKVYAPTANRQSQLQVLLVQKPEPFVVVPSIGLYAKFNVLKGVYTWTCLNGNHMGWLNHTYDSIEVEEYRKNSEVKYKINDNVFYWSLRVGLGIKL